MSVKPIKGSKSARSGHQSNPNKESIKIEETYPETFEYVEPISSAGKILGSFWEHLCHKSYDT